MTTRILQIIPTLDGAGAEKQFTLLATGLDRERFDVHACALTRGGPYEVELKKSGIPLTTIGKRWKVDPRAYWRLRQLMRRLRPDIVQTWMFAANAYGRAAALRCGVKTIIGTERCADPWKDWHQLAIDRYLAQRSAQIVVNGCGVREFYVAKGIAADRFKIIPNGITAHEPSDMSRQAFLREIGLPGGARIVAAIGRLWPQKKIKDIIWAAELLQNIRDDVRFLIVGDGPERQRLERFRDNVDIDGCVHFLGHRQDVPRWIEHIDVLWSASTYEGMPNSIMEAMAAGVPVVATDIAGNNELVVPEETGYLVPQGDTAALARHANQILDDPQLANSLGCAGRQRMLEHFSVEQMVAQHAELYDKLLENSCSLAPSQ